MKRVLFVLLSALTLQSGIAIAENTDVSIRLFDDAWFQEAETDSRGVAVVDWSDFERGFQQPIDQALRSESAGSVYSRGMSMAAPDAEGVRQVYYLTMGATVIEASNGLQILKDKLIELGADEGSRLTVHSDAGVRLLSLVQGEWVSTEDLGFEFVAEIAIADGRLTDVVESLNSSRIYIRNAERVIAGANALQPSHYWLFEGALTRVARANRDQPVQFGIFKSDDGEVTLSILSTDRHLSNLVQQAFDSFAAET